MPIAGSASAVSPKAVAPWLTNSMALLPKIENQAKIKPNGINITPSTNSRKVRPREMRAIKSPTNGAHATHQAQKKIVQPAFHSAPAAP